MFKFCGGDATKNITIQMAHRHVLGFKSGKPALGHVPLSLFFEEIPFGRHLL